MRDLFGEFSILFSDRQFSTLVLSLAIIFALILFLGDALAPFYTAVVIAYLLEGVVRILQRFHLPRMPAVLIVYSLFILLLVFLLI
ncbi:AI-2E family transporter, partial [Magnetococcales bacterium HHB-1]